MVKVPLLGDIPIIKNLFRDTSKTGSDSQLYVFITPKIMRDPDFADLRLLTRAPLAQISLPDEYPPPTIETIPIIETEKYTKEQHERQELDKNKRPPDISPAQTTPVRHDPPKSQEPD